MKFPRLRARRGQGGHDCRRGAALVEFALVFPVFILLFLGTVEFGRAFMVYQLIHNAAREGARSAVLPTTTTDAAVRARVVNYLGAAKIPTDERLTVTVGVNGNGALSAADIGDEVQVNVSIAYSDVSILTPRFMGGVTLTGIANMRHE